MTFAGSLWVISQCLKALFCLFAAGYSGQDMDYSFSDDDVIPTVETEVTRSGLGQDEASQYSRLVR